MSRDAREPETTAGETTTGETTTGDAARRVDVPAAEWNEAGSDAEGPSEIPAAGWRQILARVWRDMGDDHLSLMAAALSFYGLLAIFPLLTALVALYGLAFDPQAIREQSAQLAAILPGPVHQLVDDQLHSLVDSDRAELGLGLAVSVSLLLWAVSSGAQNLIRAVNVAYEERETRGWLRLRLLALFFTAGGLLFLIASIALIAVLPSLLEWLGGLEVQGLSVISEKIDVADRLVGALRWPLLAVAVVLALACLYRWGPDRRPAKWRWVSWGGLAAAALWLTGSFLFSWYVDRFGNYNETYGAFSTVVVLLLWFYLSAFAILMGAKINAEIEHQTLRDSTVEPELPFGERGAVVADTTPDGSSENVR